MQQTPDETVPLRAGFVPIMKRHWWATTLLVTGLVAVIAILIDPSLGEDVAPPIVIANLFTSGVLFVRKSRQFDGRERQAWATVGTAFITAGVGVIAVGVIQTVSGEVPAFGYPDLFFIGTYVMLGLGLYRLPHVAIGNLVSRLRIGVDALVGAISMAAILWVWFVADLWTNLRDVSTLERFVGALYPFADVAILVVLMIVVLRRNALRFDPRLLVIAVAFSAQAAADLMYVATGAGKTFAEAQPLFPLFVLAGMGYVATGMVVESTPRLREYADRQYNWVPMLGPYGLAVAMIFMLITQLGRSGSMLESSVLVWSSMVVAVLVVVRQAIAIRENTQHVERERRALISSISHELRTPLTAMVGFLDVLTDERSNLPQNEQRDLMGVVDQQARYMGRIVSDMVTLARGPADGLELSVSETTISDIVDRSIQIADPDGDRFEVDCPPDLGAAVDPDRVQQVLVNLLANAVRYGGDQRALVIARNGSDLLIEVHDNGRGVPKRHELAVWERFERGAHRFDARTPGSGIGLAIVAAVAKAHGGSAGYRKSERLGGACFYVVFPGRAIEIEPPENAVLVDEDVA